MGYLKKNKKMLSCNGFECRTSMFVYVESVARNKKQIPILSNIVNHAQDFYSEP